MLNFSLVLSNINRVELLTIEALRPLNEPYETALFHFFGGGLAFEEMLFALHSKNGSERSVVTPLQTEVEEAIRLVLLQIEVAYQELDGTESTVEFDVPDDLMLGGFFVDLLSEREFSKATPYCFTLTSGRQIGEIELICALMMIQIVQVTNYIQAQNAVAVGMLMWDLHRLDVEIDRILRDRDLSEEARERSRKLLQKRHRKTDEAKAAVCAEWASAPTAHPSAEKAGRHYSEWLETQGIRYEPRTVTRWIREHAKATGVKFR